jgi:hypothetical protein
MSLIYESIRINTRLDAITGSGHIITTNKGDIITDTGGSSIALGVGTDNQVLISNNAENTGLKWSSINDASISGSAGIDSTKIADGSVTNTKFQRLAVINSAVVGESDTQTLTNKTLTSPIISSITNTGILSLPTDTDILIGRRTQDILTNKSIDADASQNTITNIENANIKLSAKIDAIKIADGSVTNTEFQYINTLSSNVQTQINDHLVATTAHGVSGSLVGTTDAQTLTNKILTIPFISSISNIGLLTLPTATTTLVGHDTINTLTNKTFGDVINMNNNKIINVAQPSADSDVANKLYVDSVATGLDVKGSVISASDADLDSNQAISGTITYTATDGASSRGQITASLSTTNFFTLGNVNFSSTENGARILLKDQVTGSQNGIWTVTISGSSLTLDRAIDFDDDSKVTSGAFVFIEEGTYNNSGFVLATNGTITIGGLSGTSLTFTQFSGTGSITAGYGLTKNDNTFNVIGSTTIISNADSLEVNSSSTENQVLLSSGSSGTAPTYGSLPINDSNAVSGQLPVANGGTGVATLSAGNFVQANGASAFSATKLIPTGSVVGTTDTQTMTNKTLTTPRIGQILSNTGLLTIPTVTDTLVGKATTDTLTNKSIDASQNTITNISDADIKALASIDTTKLADGSVTNTEFQRLALIGSSVVGISDTQTLSNKTLTNPTISSIVNIGTITLPSATTILVGWGTVDILTNKTIDSDNNEITNIVNANIKTGAGIGANKIANGSVENTAFQRLGAVESAIVAVSDTQNLTNKTLTSAKIQTDIRDTYGHELIRVTGMPTAVNDITVLNAESGHGPTIRASGDNVDVDINIESKGSGNIVLDGLKWPNADGGANQVLATNGSGVIGFANVDVLTIDSIATTNVMLTTISTIDASAQGCYMLEARIVGIKSDGSAGGGFFIRSVFRYNGTTLMKVGDDKMFARDSTWDVDANISGTNIVIQVTGESATNINWKSYNKVTMVAWS